MDEWVTTKSLDDISILEYGKEILSTPSMAITKEGETQLFYSKSDMLDMFRLGVKMSKTIARKEATLLRKKKGLMSPYLLLRSLEENESETFPYEQWSSIRVAASKLKKDFGCEFKVNKVAPNGKIGDIKVVRIK